MEYCDFVYALTLRGIPHHPPSRPFRRTLKGARAYQVAKFRIKCENTDILIMEISALKHDGG